MPPQQNTSPALEDMLQTENLVTQEIPPSQPYQEVEFEEFWREYDMFLELKDITRAKKMTSISSIVR